MILKLIDGPMDGAVYALSRETADPKQRSTNRKPDGIWFDATDEHGRNVQHQYAGGNAMPLVDCKEPVVLEYRYTGPVVDTGLTLETEEHVVGTREREPEPEISGNNIADEIEAERSMHDENMLTCPNKTGWRLMNWSPIHDWCANDMCPICNQRHAEELLKP